MVVAPRWTGREAAALRHARRMSIRAYAAHLGVAVTTVANWERRGADAHLRTDTQQLLDIDLARAAGDVQQRFAALLTEEPSTDKPSTDKPSTDKPGTDKPGTAPTKLDSGVCPSCRAEDPIRRTGR